MLQRINIYKKYKNLRKLRKNVFALFMRIIALMKKLM